MLGSNASYTMANTLVFYGKISASRFQHLVSVFPLGLEYQHNKNNCYSLQVIILVTNRITLLFTDIIQSLSHTECRPRLHSTDEFHMCVYHECIGVLPPLRRSQRAQSENRDSIDPAGVIIIVSYYKQSHLFISIFSEQKNSVNL